MARMTRMKKTLIGVALFLMVTIFVPIIAWIAFDLEGTELAKYLGISIFTGLCVGGWLAWTQITRAFFEG
jgi:hypothetical protein